MNRIVAETSIFVQRTLRGDATGHDYNHVTRVANAAREIQQTEGGDLLVVELGSLLHDIADWKFHGGDETVGPATARTWLESQSVDAATVDRVCEIVATTSFKGEGTPSPSLEGRIVQDADRLDAIGAVGIARCFTYGGFKGRQIYTPEDLGGVKKMTAEEYKKNERSSIAHFYDKLLLLKDMMNTATGKKLAEDRHHFMTRYLDEFFLEWEGVA